NSSSTARVKSVPPSNASRAFATCSSHPSRCSSPIAGEGYPAPFSGTGSREQPLRDARPAPARHDCLARRSTQSGPVRLPQLEDLAQLGLQLVDVAVLERCEMPQPLGVLLLQPGGD